MLASRLFRAALSLCALLSLAVPIDAGSEQPDRVRRTLLLAPTTPLTLRADVGSISITGWSRPDVSIEGEGHADIVVRAPFHQAVGPIELFEGRISLKDLRGGVRARVEHGSIDAESLAGAVRLETVIGDIRLDRAELSAEGTIRLRTFNGDIALGFISPPVHARILALSLGGLIHSDLPLTLRTTFGPRFGELTLGRGSPVVSIDVVRGNIRIIAGHP